MAELFGEYGGYTPPQVETKPVINPPLETPKPFNPHRLANLSLAARSLEPKSFARKVNTGSLKFTSEDADNIVASFASPQHLSDGVAALDALLSGANNKKTRQYEDLASKAVIKGLPELEKAMEVQVHPFELCEIISIIGRSMVVRYASYDTVGVSKLGDVVAKNFSKVVKAASYDGLMASAVSNFIAYATPDQLRQAEDGIVPSFQSPDFKERSSAMSLISALTLSSKVGTHNVAVEAKYMARDIVRNVVQNYQELEEVWGGGNGAYVPIKEGEHEYVYSQKKQQDSINKNCLTILQLEAAQPGSTDRLYEDYGIKNFRRYWPSDLLRQLNRKTAPGAREPYALFITADYDRNDGFNYAALPNNSAVRQMQEQGLPVIVIEAGNKAEAAARLLKVVRSHGKASAMVLGGHGQITQIEMGNPRNPEAVFSVLDLIHAQTKDRFNRSQGEKLANLYLNPGAELILVSCSTGGVDSSGFGMAKDISAFGVGVHAPDNASWLEKIQVIGKEGDIPKFKVRYGNGAASLNYKNGVLVDSN